MKRKKESKKKAMLFIIFVLMLLIGVGIVQISRAYMDNKEREAEVVVLMDTIKEEQLKQLELLKVKEEMKTRAFIEKTARSKFGLIYPDETLIDIAEKE
jgi:cell division protein FtsB